MRCNSIYHCPPLTILHLGPAVHACTEPTVYINGLPTSLISYLDKHIAWAIKLTVITGCAQAAESKINKVISGYEYIIRCSHALGIVY